MFLFQGAFSAKKLPTLAPPGGKVAVEGFREGWSGVSQPKKGWTTGPT